MYTNVILRNYSPRSDSDRGESSLRCFGCPYLCQPRGAAPTHIGPQRPISTHSKITSGIVQHRVSFCRIYPFQYTYTYINTHPKENHCKLRQVPTSTHRSLGDPLVHFPRPLPGCQRLPGAASKLRRPAPGKRNTHVLLV